MASPTVGIQEAFARLTALKKNARSGSEEYIAEYHAALDVLEGATGEDMARFRIPETALKPRLLVAGRRKPIYANDREVDLDLLRLKIDTVLGLFQLRSSSTEIGFKPANPPRQVAHLTAEK